MATVAERIDAIPNRFLKLLAADAESLKCKFKPYYYSYWMFIDGSYIEFRNYGDGSSIIRIGKH